MLGTLDRPADLRDGDAPRRPRARALRLPPLRQLPLGRPLRQAEGSHRPARTRSPDARLHGRPDPGPLGDAAAGQAQGTQGDAPAEPRIDEASAKIRSGPPADDAADVTWPTWGGVLPLAIHAGDPQPDEHEKAIRPPRTARAHSSADAPLRTRLPARPPMLTHRGVVRPARGDTAASVAVARRVR